MVRKIVFAGVCMAMAASSVAVLIVGIIIYNGVTALQAVFG